MKNVKRNTFSGRLSAAWRNFWRTLKGQTIDTINIGVEVKRCDECEHKRGLNAKTMVVDLALDGDTDDVRYLRELLNVKDEGRLVELPCKVGTTVWYRTYEKNATVDLGVQPHVVESYRLSMVTDSWTVLPAYEFGRTVFLTREEAEAALKGGADG